MRKEHCAFKIGWNGNGNFGYGTFGFEPPCRLQGRGFQPRRKVAT